MSGIEDFIIENGNLKKYRGSDTDVIIPDGVTTISNDAFGFCESIATVVIPDSVTSIGGWVFYGCKKLTSITLGAGVTSFDTWSIEGCNMLETIAVSPDNTCYTSVDGVLFNKSKTKLMKFPRGKKATEYSIPDSVTSIGEFSFYDCKNLKTITVPDGVESIDANAFLECTNLSTFIMPDSVTKIGFQSFRGCTNLTTIKISNSLTSIYSGAFRGCKNVTSVSIPDNIESIGKNAFADCKNLTTVYFSDGIKKISGDAFGNCPRLKHIGLPGPKDVFESSALEVIWNYFFASENKLCLLVSFLTQALPVVWNNDGIKRVIKANKKKIFDFAIEEDSPEIIEGLFSLYKSIQLDALNNCIEKADLAIRVKAFLLDYKANKYSAEKQAAYENEKFEKEIGIRERTVTEWKKIYKFVEENDQLTITGYKGTDTKIEIPGKIGKYTVAAIGVQAFCPRNAGLREKQITTRRNMQMVVIHDGVTSIGKSAFSDCIGLTSITIPDSVECICDNAFFGCKNISTITLPPRVKSIGKRLFVGCYSLAEINIPEGVKSIEREAFVMCRSLGHIEIPNSVTSIGPRAFLGCEKLTIYAQAGSCAEEYAKENDIPFVAK